LKENWLRLVETNVLCNFIDVLLRGYGQVFFCNNPLVGLIILIGFVDNPISGILSLICSICATGTAILIRAEHSFIKSGLFSCSGALIGLAFSVYLPVNLLLILFLIPAGVLSAVLTKVLIKNLATKLNLPTLTIPFVLVTWTGLFFLRYVPIAPVMSDSLPKFLMSGQIEQMLYPLLPESVSTIFHTISAILFQNSILIGIFCVLGIITYSRISAIFGLAGATIGVTLGLFITGGVDSITIGFNCALISIALGGSFIILNWQSTLYALFATSMGAVIGLALINLLGILNVPALASPFNLVTLLFLYIAMIVSTKSNKAGLKLIPLVQVNSPEANLKRHLMADARRIKQQVRLSLPFYGTWYVSSGNNTQPTHSGVSTYAWDFIVLDKREETWPYFSVNNEDYYSFGLPVIAPAAGTVVRVTNSIPDNTPPIVNQKQRLGNYVIIDHGNNEFSEIAHFKQNSIVVREGDKVVRGQLLGYCGNTGLSKAPHIHYQLQKASTAGATSMPGKFHNYMIHKGPAKITVKEGLPEERQFISNPPSEAS
jgi:urea transporter